MHENVVDLVMGVDGGTAGESQERKELGKREKKGKEGGKVV